MKRDIVCIECARRQRAAWHKPEQSQSYPVKFSPYPGEYIKFVKGEAKANYAYDTCGERIQEENLCEAVSIWSDTSRHPYYEWEANYLNIS